MQKTAIAIPVTPDSPTVVTSPVPSGIPTSVTNLHTGWSTVSVIKTVSGAFIAGVGIGTIATAAMFHLLAALLLPSLGIIGFGFVVTYLGRRTFRRARRS